MPRSEHAKQRLSLLSTCLQMLQHINFKLRMSRFHLNFKCFGISPFRTHFPDTTLLLFRDFFRYDPIIATRSFKLWYAYSKHCFCYFETWRFTSFRSKRLIHLASNNIIKIFSQHYSSITKESLFKSVDDMIVTGDDMDGINDLKLQLSQQFEMKDLGTLRHFLVI